MSPDRSRRSIEITISLLLIAATFATFWSVQHNDFINYDDQVYLTKNEAVQQGLTWAGVKYAFTSGDVGNWHPITWLSHLVDVELFGMDAGGHHVMSVAWHGLNAVLLFWVLRRLTGLLWASALVAAVFALHPLRVESVAWASERKDLLAAFFGCAAILAYQRFAQMRAAAKRSWPWFGVALLAHALSLMSKPMLVTLPCLLLLLDYWPLRRLRLFGQHPDGLPLAKLVLEKIPFLALSIGSSIITVIVQSGAGAVATTQLFPLDVRIQNAVLATVRYLQKNFWPAELGPFYPYELDQSGLPVLSCALLLGIIFSAAWATRKKYPFLAVGWLWYVGLLIPVIGLVQVGSQSMADRYTYLPMIGVIIALVWLGQEMLNRCPQLKWPIIISTVVLLGRLGQLSQEQVLRWRDSETLFNHTLTITRENAIAHESLGLVFADRGAVKLATWHFREAVRIWPSYDEAVADLGLALSLQGKFDEALRYAQRAMESNPNSERIQYNLARLYLRMGSNDMARAEFERFHQKFPASQAGVLSLAEALIATGATNRAAEVLANFTEDKAADERVWLALGHTLTAQGRDSEALTTFARATEINATSTPARTQYGLALLRAGQPEAAIRELRPALAAKPGYEIHLGLAEAYSNLGQDREAIIEYRSALKFNPDVPGPLNNLAWLLATSRHETLRDGKQAVEYGEKAARLTGDREVLILGTLAAAYAEAGRFADAIATAERAISFARLAGQDSLAARNEELLELYRAGRPYREAAPE